MVAIFTTSTVLDQICHSDELNPWQDMIMKLGEVFTTEDIDIPLDDEDPLFLLDASIKIDTSKDNLIKAVLTEPKKVLEEPCGIYLLDIPSAYAKSIQDSYGVICQSLSVMDHSALTKIHGSAEQVEGERGKDWKDIFKKFKNSPTNSALIIDAHLFENDYWDERQDCYDQSRNYGLVNLREIIEEILPDTFSDTYHIGVLLTDTDEAKAKRKSRTNLTNAQIATAINKLKKRISRSYPISIEVLFFSSGDDHHKLIHNRRILTNTYVLDAQYKLAALSNGIARASQTIYIYPLFELIHMGSDEEMKEKRLRYDLDDLYEYIQIQCRAQAPSGQLYRNGALMDSYFKIQHRFLR